MITLAMTIKMDLMFPENNENIVITDGNRNCKWLTLKLSLSSGAGQLLLVHPAEDIWPSPRRTVNALGTCSRCDKPIPFPDTSQPPPWGGGAGQELQKFLTILSGGKLYLLTVV